MRPKKPTVDLGPELSVGSYLLVEPFGSSPQAEVVIIQPPEEFPSGAEGVKHRLGTGKHGAIQQNQLNGLIKRLLRNFREAPGNVLILRGLIIYAPTSKPLPSRDPDSAEMTVTVVYEQRLDRRIGDFKQYAGARSFGVSGCY